MHVGPEWETFPILPAPTGWMIPVKWRTVEELELDACLAEAMAILLKLNLLGRHSLETMDRHAKLVQRVEILKEKP